jgi:biopolymer transport protein TolR
MARNFRRHRSAQPIADLNVTNLIDLGFMLLIIFMVVATVSKQEQTLPVNLPVESKSLQTKADPDDKFQSITIYPDGTTSFNGRRLPLPQLAKEFATLGSQTKPPVIRVRLDAKSTVQHLISVMDEMKKNKLNRFTIDTQIAP